MLHLSSLLKSGKYKGRSIRELVYTDPHFLYHNYVNDPEFDLHLDVVRAMEQRGFNMRRANVIRLRMLSVD